MLIITAAAGVACLIILAAVRGQQRRAWLADREAQARLLAARHQAIEERANQATITWPDLTTTTMNGN